MPSEWNNKLVSKNNTGFPGYLDFSKLRSEAITHIGDLSGKIWTDHNVHDPGITILETLIYALLDLGYRTNLPIEDLLASDPADNSNDNNFFFPTRILGSNPLTITDFRKLLVDIMGVKNAWLEIDEETPVLYCKEQIPGAVLFNEAGAPANDKHFCDCDKVNGLYHVYLQLEDGIIANSAEADQIIGRTKKALMAHRNLCEDFIDIKILCTLELGLCADFELEYGVDLEETYRLIVSKLCEFFSPSPRFYTFKQLIDKGKSVDEIYAGRPFDISQSYGFVDEDEFEQLKLRKALHLSDVYHLLFDIKGIRNVRNLGWITCCDKADLTSESNWELRLPKDHIPVFSIACSGFRFYQLGLPVKIDTQKIEKAAPRLIANSRGIYKLPSPDLEPQYSKGNYRSDLATYFSIQNEFPKVYGITEGGLESNAPVSRIAKARQLQGYLLFFDQLLANYLMQLKNIRSLFSMNSSTKKELQQTYFINRLSDVPYLKELVRFATDEGVTGNEGNILAYPTSRKNLENHIEKNTLRYRRNRSKHYLCKEDFPEYSFCSSVQRDQAAVQLRHDLKYAEFEPVVVANSNDCYFFYLFTTSVEFAMISKDFYRSEQDAKNAANSFKYAATSEMNFRKSMLKGITLTDDRFSFDIELNVATYASYLQELVEDKDLYHTRRQDFLNHLLARFAEQFTDFALLSSDFFSPDELKKEQIKAEEKFLTYYEDISANRGRAYDYTKDTTRIQNISGFEKRIKGLTGIENWDRNWLCNFEVEAADLEYRIIIDMFNESFIAEDKSTSKEEALSCLSMAYKYLRTNPAFEIEKTKKGDGWQIYFSNESKQKFTAAKIFDTKEKALDASQSFEKAFHFIPLRKETAKEARMVSQVKLYDAKGNDAMGNIIAESARKFDDAKTAVSFLNKVASNLSLYLGNKEEFIFIDRKKFTKKLVLKSKSENAAEFFDATAFDYKEVYVPHLKEKKTRFSMINKEGTLQFDSLTNKDTPGQAKKEFNELLHLMHEGKAFEAEKDLDENVYKIYLKEGDQRKAVYFESFPEKSYALDKVSELINTLEQHRYYLRISDQEPDTWKFIFTTPDLEGNEFVFDSDAVYKKEEQAWTAAQEFYRNLHQAEVKKVTDGLELRYKNNIRLVAKFEKGEQAKLALAEKSVKEQQKTFAALKTADEKYLEKKVGDYQLNKQEEYIFKLVDKNNPLAFVTQNVWRKYGNNADTVRSEMMKQATTGYNYVDIYLAGDIFRERIEPISKAKRYHYQIKCRNRYYTNGPHAGKELILFESIYGYTSKEEAQKEFDKKYSEILYKAMFDTNYGDNRPISYKEILQYKKDTCNFREAIVFIPDETTKYFGEYQTERDIIPLVCSYPIRLIGKDRYIFVATVIDPVSKNAELHWRSKSSYTTALQARHQFYFFLRLLKYKGNFYLQHPIAGYPQRLYLREVLAVSAHGYESCEKAWGKEGIEKFICIAQAKDGFHNYWNSDNCHYSFYVACGNMGLIHPCTYETPERRDAALDRLLAGKRFNFLDLLISKGTDHFILREHLKNPDNAKELAIIDLKELKYVGGQETDGERKKRYCEWLMLFSRLIHDDANYKEVEEKDASGKPTGKTRWTIGYEYSDPLVGPLWHTLAESMQPEMNQKDWKAELLKVFCYFPIIENENKFYVDIRLPGSACCSHEIKTGCEDQQEESECDECCYTSWKSECCFGSCFDAFTFYFYALALLDSRENYKPVFDCNCGSYRIELHPQLNQEGKSAFINSYKSIHEKVITSSLYTNSLYGKFKTNPNVDPSTIECLSEIIAINPQRYGNEKMACEAVTRAKKLINNEGLHLVEHILLRPRCPDKNGKYTDCDCNGTPLHKPCTPKSENICHFKWLPGGEPDPCEIQEIDKEDKSKEKITCFTPGCDPYSFIATVVMPAWPARFRSKSGRERIERALRREAPAHVMLRFLWMNPKDFCCFEYYYREWNQWLADKKLGYKYSNCDFLGFLFDKKLSPLEECKDCIPCAATVESEANCFEKKETKKRVIKGKAAPRLMMLSLAAGEVTDPDLSSKLSVAISKLFCWEEGNWIQKETYKECHPCSSKDNSDFQVKVSKEMSAIFNTRYFRYSGEVKELKDKFEELQTPGEVDSYLSSREANPDLYRLVIEKITDPEGEWKQIDDSLRQQLVSLVTWRYLDLVCYREKNIDKIVIAAPVFRKLRNAGINMSLLYEKWESWEISEYIIDIEKINQAITEY